MPLLGRLLIEFVDFLMILKLFEVLQVVPPLKKEIIHQQLEPGGDLLTSAFQGI